MKTFSLTSRCKSLVVLILIILSVSCTTVKKDILSRDYVDHPLSGELVRVVKNVELVQHCQQVASLKAEGERPEHDMVVKLQNEAGKLGANTLLVFEVKRPEAKDIVSGVVEAAAAAALNTSSKTPRAQSIMAEAYYCTP